MDFIFHDDGADTIRRELMAPRAAIVQSLFQVEPSKQRMERYVKMAQICFGDIVNDGVPGSPCTQNSKSPTGRIPTGNQSPDVVNLEEEGSYDTILDEEFHEQLMCHFEQDVERELDPLARQAADLIMANSDWDDIEYGFLIYYGPNGLRLGEIVRGNAVGVDIPLRLQAGETVIARVHNHPRGGIGAPSNRDRVGMDYLLVNGHTDGPTFSDYIIDYDSGEFNEFDFPEDEELDEPTEETKNDAEGKC